MSETENTVLYVLMRGDLPSMNGGKAIAHGAHAGGMATKIAQDPKSSLAAIIREQFSAWEGDRGFGVTLAIEVPSLDMLRGVVETASRAGYFADLVVDDTYPYRVPSELIALIDPSYHTLDPIPGEPLGTCFRVETTCGFVFGNKDRLVPLLSQFNLHP